VRQSTGEITSNQCNCSLILEKTTSQLSEAEAENLVRPGSGERIIELGGRPRASLVSLSPNAGLCTAPGFWGTAETGIGSADFHT